MIVISIMVGVISIMVGVILIMVGVIAMMVGVISMMVAEILASFRFYNGGQKCWDLSSDITKTSDSSPPTPNKVEFGAKWGKLSAFLATTLLGEVGGRWDEPKAEQKIVLRSRILRNYCLEGLFHTVPSSFVLHCRMRTTTRPRFSQNVAVRARFHQRHFWRENVIAVVILYRF